MIWESDFASAVNIRCALKSKQQAWDFPGYPVVKTSPSSERERYASSIPGQGAKTPHASMPKQTKNIKQKKYCNKFNKGFKNGPLKKKKKQQAFSGNCMLEPRRYSE